MNDLYKYFFFGWIIQTAYFTGLKFGSEGITFDTVIERIFMSSFVLGSMFLICYLIVKFTKKYEIKKRYV